MATRNLPDGITPQGIALELLKRGKLTFNSFCRDIIKTKPTWQQQEFIDAWDGGHRRIAVRSGHGPGKSTVLGWFVIYYLLSWDDALIPITGAAFDQVKKTLWKEVTKAYRRLPMKAKNQLEKLAAEIKRKDNPEESFAFIRTADDADNFQGFHSKHMVIIVDEASGVEDDIFEVIEGAMTEDGNGLLLTGNPTKLSGEFYSAFHRNRDLYKLLHWNGEDSPLVSKEQIARQRQKYGHDSNEYKIRVLGEFPDSDENSLISLADIEACVALGKSGNLDPDGPLVYGVDVGRQGTDPSVICKRKGAVVGKLQSRHGLKGPAVAGWVLGEAKTDNPSAINVDVIGIGAGVADTLDLVDDCPSHDVNVAERGVHNLEEPDRFFNLRAELYWWLMEEISIHNLALPDDDELVKELSMIRYFFTKTGLIQIEEKEAMKHKKRLGRSPDRADALMLTYYKPKTAFNELLQLACGG